MISKFGYKKKGSGASRHFVPSSPEETRGGMRQRPDEKNKIL